MAPELASAVTLESVKTAITAAGTTIADATALSADFNLIETAAASTGVKLPDWPVGSVLYVKNSGANTVNVFPHGSSGTINAGSPGAAQTIASTKKGRFIRESVTNWDYTLEN